MKKTVSLLLALALCLGLTVPALAAPSFTDVPADHWGCARIGQAAGRGWVKGMGGGRFGPDRQVTCAQFATMLCQAFFKDEAGGYSAAGPWYARYCTAAGELGLFEGTAAGDYAAMDSYADVPVNRYDMAQMVYNAMKAKDMLGTVDISAAKASTADWDAIPIQYRVAVAVCKDAKIINGMDKQGTFAGGGNMTRAQACVVLIGLDSYIAGQPEKPVEPEKPAEPEKPPVGARSPFAFKDGENVQQMMDRLNKEAPAYTEGYLTNGKPITEANIKEMLDAAKESMPDYTPWGPDDSTRYVTSLFPGYAGGGGCTSFSAGLSDYIFGKDAPVTKHQNFDQLKVGDIVWMSDSSTGYEHMVLVTDVSEIGEGFFVKTEGNTNRVVRWGTNTNMNRWSDTQKAETYIYTRY